MNASADVLIEPADLASDTVRRAPAGTDLLASRIAGLSMSAPYAVPKRRPGLDFVNLVNGAPAAEALPFAEIRQTTDTLFADPALGVQALEYGPNAGEPVLRQLIADREGVPADRILITNGGLHGTALVGPEGGDEYVRGSAEATASMAVLRIRPERWLSETPSEGE